MILPGRANSKLLQTIELQNQQLGIFIWDRYRKMPGLASLRYLPGQAIGKKRNYRLNSDIELIKIITTVNMQWYRLFKGSFLCILRIRLSLCYLVEGVIAS